MFPGTMASYVSRMQVERAMLLAFVRQPGRQRPFVVIFVILRMEEFESTAARIVHWDLVETRRVKGVVTGTFHSPSVLIMSCANGLIPRAIVAAF